MKKAVITSDEILKKYGALRSEGSATAIEIKNWKFSSFHDKICNTNDLLNLARNIENIVLNDSPSLSGQPDNHQSSHRDQSDHIHIDGYSLHLPPMLFLNDYMNIEYSPSNISLRFLSSDSLVTWASRHETDMMNRHPLVIPQVPYANTWTKRSLPVVSEAAADLEGSIGSKRTDSNSRQSPKQMGLDL